MSIRAAKPLIIATASLMWLCGCSSSPKLSDLWNSKSADASSVPAPNDAETTGSTAAPPSESARSGAPFSLSPNTSLASVGGPNDDVQLGKKYFRSNNYGLAEKSFRSAVQKHPGDAEAWVGLAASYDRLHRFDLADRAYESAMRIVGPTVEILNNQGFSYMLRGDYARAHKKLEEAEAKDPANPYVAANMRLLEDSYREGKAIQ